MRTVSGRGLEANQTADQVLAGERREYHQGLQRELWSVSCGLPSNSDPGNRTSIAIGLALAEVTGATKDLPRLDSRSAQIEFERQTVQFTIAAFSRMAELDQVDWSIKVASSGDDSGEHDYLRSVRHEAATNDRLARILVDDYTMAPCSFIARQVRWDEGAWPSLTRPADVRSSELEAMLACKWMIPRDLGERAVNLLRSSERLSVHRAIVTAEPLPSRLAAIAFGTESQCIYHVALHELQSVLGQGHWYDAMDALEVLINERRIRDISALPIHVASRVPAPGW